MPYLQLVETPFLVAVERTLDERYTPQMETIYKILIGNYSKKIFQKNHVDRERVKTNIFILNSQIRICGF